MQADGAVAAAVSDGVTYEPVQVSWFSPRNPRGRRLPLRTIRGDHPPLVVAANRIVALRDRGERASELVVVNLDGRTRILERFRRSRPVAGSARASGQLDFDGRRVVWASTRTIDPGRRCPPNSGTIGPPCTSLPEVGVTTIWRHDLPTGRRTAVARLPFRTHGTLP